MSNRSWEPRWLHAGRPCEQQAQDLWSVCAQSCPNATIHFDPSVVLGRHQNDAAPIVYARWTPGQHAKLNSLAILTARQYGVRPLPCLKWQVQLPARHVVESALAGDDGPESIETFVSTISDFLQTGEVKCIVFPDLDADSPLRGALIRSGASHHAAVFCPTQPAPHRWIKFPDEPETYWSQFSKKTRYNFRYRAKHLPHSIRCINRPEDVPQFLNHVENLVNRSWQHRRLGTSLIKDRKLELWRKIAELGALRSYLLMQDDRALAFAIGYQWKDRFIYEETGYDPEFAASSPGQVLLYRVIEDLIARDTPKLFDFGYGDSEYKQIFANHETRSGPVVLVHRSPLPMLAMHLAGYRALLGRHTRALLAKARVLSTLRHIHRGH